MKFSTDGLIIGEMSLGEKDRIVTILTRSQGVIRAFVKGVTNLKNPKFNSTRLLCYSDIVVYEGRDKYFVDSAESKEMFMPLRLDIEKMSLAQYFCQLCTELAPANLAAAEYLRLMLNSLFVLCKGTKPDKLVKAVFELRLLAMAGYMPDLVACRSCGEFENDKMAFYPDDGTLQCGNCTNAGGRCIRTGIGATAAMRHSIYAADEKIFSFSLAGDSLNAFSRAAEEYMLAHTEKPLQTLSFYKTISTENNNE